MISAHRPESWPNFDFDADDDACDSRYGSCNVFDSLRKPVLTPNQHDALLIIDVQNDFCPNGALAVPEGDQVVPVINQLTSRFQTIVLTQDWHPAGHASFASTHGAEPFSTTTLHYGEQTLWPDHCVQGSDGAEFHQQLQSNGAALIIRKGMHPGIDSYSAFFENDKTTSTGLGGYLRAQNIKRVFCVGLAYDYCVRFTAEDAMKEQFDTVVIKDACRAIDMNNSAADATGSFDDLGIAMIHSSDVTTS